MVISQSSFERVSAETGTERRFVEARIETLREAIAASRADKGLTVKRLERTLAAYEERQKALVADARRDEGALTFEASGQGVDYLVVDETHLYKNLAISARIPGGASTGYKRASDLAMKLDWLRERHGRRVATFSTAPPIANGIAEILRDAALPAS